MEKVRKFKLHTGQPLALSTRFVCLCPGSSLQSSSTQKVYAKDREKLATDLVGRFKNQAMMMERSKQSFSFKFPASVFHSEQDHHVTIDPTDMLDLCNQNQIGSNHISIFMK